MCYSVIHGDSILKWQKLQKGKYMVLGTRVSGGEKCGLPVAMVLAPKHWIKRHRLAHTVNSELLGFTICFTTMTKVQPLRILTEKYMGCLQTILFYKLINL